MNERVFVGIVFLIFFSFIAFDHIPRFSFDPRIRELQREAIRLKIWSKSKEMRNNGKEFFGWEWHFWYNVWHTDEYWYENNEVSFKGSNGRYWIRYKDVLVEWNDCRYLKVFHNDSLVYEAKMKMTLAGVENRFRKITAFIPGNWTEVFNEMYSQAIKGFPKEPEEDVLKKNWGIG